MVSQSTVVTAQPMLGLCLLWLSVISALLICGALRNRLRRRAWRRLEPTMKREAAKATETKLRFLLTESKLAPGDAKPVLQGTDSYRTNDRTQRRRATEPQQQTEAESRRPLE
jgi:hypothetical protein